MIKHFIYRFAILYFFLTVFSLLLYTFTQVDLNLTLFTNTLYQYIQTSFTQLGYYNRPLSASIYYAIVISLFLSYIAILYSVKNNLITINTVKKILIAVIAILLFSYPAFSYDIYNYMFDAKIVTTYGQNPYAFKALDFPLDPWVRFMRWTHRVYPYGPLWIITSLPFSFLGFGKFIPTLLLFKLYFSTLYLGCIYFIFQSMKKLDQSGIQKAVVFFSLNPLIIIESLISPHNDLLTLLLILISIYYLVQKKEIQSFTSMFFSVLVKYISLPLLFVFVYKRIVKKIEVEKMIEYFYWVYALSIVILSFLRELLPWYVVPLVGLASLANKNLYIRYVTILVSFFFLI